MSSPSTPGDPRTGRNRRVPARAHTFKHGTVDPVTSHRRPLLTVGNLILLVLMVGFGLYATGNLPQLDAFFDHVNNYGRVHNNLVVNILITYGAFLFGALVLALVLWMVFLFVNANRRSHSDPKGWHKIANTPPQRRKSERRNGVKRPSVILPLGKERIANSPATPAPQTVPVTAKAETTPPVLAAPSPQPDTAKAAAIAAAAKAEAVLINSPADLPSFIRPLGKYLRQNAEIPVSATPPAATAVKATADTTTAASANAEATIAAARATAAKAEAAIAAAKAEAAIAAAKAELAAAEAVIAAAKAQSLAN